ncbi:MAG TPA: hypothetical protein VFT64_11040 [Rickettsiales bacterium]|nr:hypothetical protein [Rickettsiales bacterium]
MFRKTIVTVLGLGLLLTSLSGCIVEPARPAAVYYAPPPPPRYYIAPAPVYYHRYHYRYY